MHYRPPHTRLARHTYTLSDLLLALALLAFLLIWGGLR